jgi:hypothetical protein
MSHHIEIKHVFYTSSIQHEDYEDTDVLVSAPGSLFWVPPVTSHTSCKLDFTYWPWDVQICDLTIGSWTRHGWDIDVVNMDGKNVSLVRQNPRLHAYD